MAITRFVLLSEDGCLLLKADCLPFHSSNFADYELLVTDSDFSLKLNQHSNRYVALYVILAPNYRPLFLSSDINLFWGYKN